MPGAAQGFPEVVQARVVPSGARAGARRGSGPPEVVQAGALGLDEGVEGGLGLAEVDDHRVAGQCLERLLAAALEGGVHQQLVGIDLGEGPAGGLGRELADEERRCPARRTRFIRFGSTS